MTWTPPKRRRGAGSIWWTRGRGWRASYPHETTGERVEWPVPRGSTTEKRREDYRAASVALDARLTELRALLDAGDVDMGNSLASVKQAFLASLVQRNVRSRRSDRSRWERFIEHANFYRWPIDRIGPGHVQSWVNSLAHVHALNNGKRLQRRISDQTRKHALGLARRAFRFAIIRYNLRCANPAALISVHVPEPDWTWLSVPQQQALLLCATIPLEARLRYAFAMGCGLRRDEWQSLRYGDLELGDLEPSMLVQRAAKNKARKRRRERVPLFGVALAAVKAWLPLRHRYAPRNQHDWLWPTPRGSKRDERPFGVHEHYAAAGVDEHSYITGHPYHVLRHTCATSLLNQLWNGLDEPHGRRWTLAEVRQQLGHSSVKTTEKYAHLTQPSREPSGLVEIIETITSPVAKGGAARR